MLTKGIWMEIRQLFEQGICISEISRMLNIDRKTVRKYAKGLIKPTYKSRLPANTLLDEHKNYLIERLSAFDFTARKLFKEI